MDSTIEQFWKLWKGWRRARNPERNQGTPSLVLQPHSSVREIRLPFSTAQKRATMQEVSLHGVPEESTRNTRRYPRISLPNGMPVSWYGPDLQLSSRVKTLGMGGLFISTPNPPPVGTEIRLTFEVPDGSVRADAIVRNVAPAEGFGAEFTRMALGDKILLQKLMNRLLRDVV